MTYEAPDQHVADDELVDLALGFLAGERRAAVLAHVDSCASCSSTLDQYSVGADALLQLAPSIDPPVGFEVRTLGRMSLERPPIRLRRRRPMLLRAAAAVLVILLGVGIGRFAIPDNHSSPGTPVTHGELTTALTHDGHAEGTVVIFNDRHPWLLMTMPKVPNGSLVICKVSTYDNRLITVGSYWITTDSHSWQARLPIPSSEIREVVIANKKGTVLASAPV